MTVPGYNLHLRLAHEVLGAAPAAPGFFPVSDGACRAAFLLGANGPDMGYYPRGEPFLSDLCHYVRSAELARALVRRARPGPEGAFAWGWVTHVLADIAIHPLINRAAAELVGTASRQELRYDDDPVAHVRVETGLDGFLLVRDGRPTRPTGRFGLPPAVRRCLIESYRETYGVALEPGRVAAAGRALVRTGPWLFALGRVTGHRLTGRTVPLQLLPVRLGVAVGSWASGWNRAGVGHAFFNATRPPEWLVDEVVRVVAGFAKHFCTHWTTRLAQLSDCNLDTGRPCAAEPSYPSLMRTLDRLRRERNDHLGGMPSSSASSFSSD